MNGGVRYATPKGPDMTQRATMEKPRMSSTTTMTMGIVGLGRMGLGCDRLRRAGHTVVGYDRNPAVSDVGSLQALVSTHSTRHALCG